MFSLHGDRPTIPGMGVTFDLRYLLYISAALVFNTAMLSTAHAQHAVSGSVMPSRGKDIVGVVNASRFEVLLNSGDGTSFTHTPYLTGLNSNWLVTSAELGDLNGDGLDDLAFTVQEGQFDSAARRLYTALNTGNGTFAPPQQIVPTCPTICGRVTSVRLVDMDGDQDLDLMISHTYVVFDPFSDYTSYRIATLTNDGLGNMSNPVFITGDSQYASGSGFDEPFSYVLSNVWRIANGNLQVALFHPERRYVHLLEATDATTMTEISEPNYAAGQISFDGIGDFEGGDGYVDLLSRNKSGPKKGFLLGASDGSMTPTEMDWDELVHSAAGDFNGDWRSDFTLLQGAQGQQSRFTLLHFADDFIPFLTVNGATSLVHAADLTGDGADDLVTTVELAEPLAFMRYYPSLGNTQDGFGEARTFIPNELRAVTSLHTGYLQPALAGFKRGGNTIRLLRTSDSSVVATTSTDPLGNFHFANVANGSYRVQPERDGYNFSPTRESETITIASQPFLGVRYVAAVDPGPDPEPEPEPEGPLPQLPAIQMRQLKVDRNTGRISFRVVNSGSVAGCTLALGVGAARNQETTVKTFNLVQRHIQKNFVDLLTRPLPNSPKKRLSISLVRSCPGYADGNFSRMVANPRRGKGNFRAVELRMARTAIKAIRRSGR